MVTDTSSLKRQAIKLWQQDQLPRQFTWMERLSAMHYRLCLIELHSAIAHAHLTGDWDAVARLVDEWEATALVDANPDFQKLVQHSDEDEYEDYEPPLRQGRDRP
jgi:hypothetical protein